MPDETPVDFTQTVVGVATPVSSRSHHSGSHHEALEGRFPPGTLLNGRYRIIAILGRGGMGEVYRATDLTLGQSVALKFLPHLASNDPRWLERFHSEVRIARQVSHPNVCRVYDIGESDGLPFLSMEYVDGEDLSTLLRRIGRFPADKAVEIARKICAGLAAAHARGVIHRDLKPQNIMIDRRGEVLICDFGLAAVASELGVADVRQGTPAYMAPEQLKGTEVTLQSDIYALGLVLFELFTGRKAYLGASINELLNQQEAMSLTSMNALAADIDPAVEKVIRRCLDPIPVRRPTSALAVSAALPGGDPLAAALAAGQTPTPEMVAASKSEGLSRRLSVPLLAISLLVLAAFPYLQGHISSLNYTPLDLAPPALEARSHELAAGFGYPDKPLDSIDFIESRDNIKTWLEKQGDGWQKRFLAEPTVNYSYRQSMAWLPDNPDGRVLWNRPAAESPGMLRLTLSSAGDLRLFEAVPFRREDTPPFAWDESRLFSALRFDRSQFKEAAPFRTPAMPFDQRVALRGPHPKLPGTELDIQYATWKGRLTSLYIQAPWSPPILERRVAPSALQSFQQYFTVLALVVFLFFSANLAHTNWVANRADRRGAFRLFVIRMTMLLGAWVCGAHIVPDLRMVNFISYAIGESLLSGLILWQLYLALEPALRARWPKSLVTWNRLLSGHFSDPQVGAHLLMGVGIGIAVTATFLAKDWINFERTGFSNLSSLADFSTRDWISSHLYVANNALTIGFLLFFTIFGLKVLFRRDLPAILVAALVVCLTSGDLASSKNLLMDGSFYFLISLGIVFALVRFGLLTTIVAVAATNALGRTANVTDLTAWFMPYTVATLLMLAGLAVYGFWRSLGGQNLVGEDPR